jgi:hypothetical protein
MSAVVNAIGDAVSFVADTAGKVVEGALNDPIGTMAKVAAVATGQFELLPVISAADTLAHGGDLGDALKSGAVTYAAGQVGGWAGNEVNAATNYGTDIGSQQTSMLAAQDVGMGTDNLAGNLAKTVAGSATGAALSGGDVNQAVLGGLAGYGAGLGLNAAGQVINQAGEVVANSIDELTTPTYGDQPGDYPTTPEELAAADLQLGGLPGTGGDQPGDYPTTPEELAAADAELGKLPGLDTVTGDQPGDYPTTPEELAAADAELAKIPAAEVTADQPGDYPQTPEELAAADAELGALPGADSGINTKAIQDYFTNQFKNRLVSNLLGGGSGTMALAGGLNALGSGSTGNYTSASGNLVSPIIGGGGDVSGALPDPMQAFRNAPTDTAEENKPMTSFGTSQELEFDPATGLMKPKAVNPYLDVNEGGVKPTLNMATGGSTTPTSSVNVNSFGTATNPILNAVYSDTLFPKQVAKIPVRNPLEAFSHADGGSIPGHNPEFYSEGGASMANRYVKGQGDGTSDSVPAMLASGEFVIPADVVSGLGNGDNDAGAKVLDEFLATIRKHKRAADARQLPPDSKGPLAYLTQAKKKVRK